MLCKSFKILAGLTFLALSAVPLGAFRPAAPRLPAYGAAPGFMVLEGVTYENLTLFPVIATSYIETGGFLTLDQGLANGDVVVRADQCHELPPQMDEGIFVAGDGTGKSRGIVGAGMSGIIAHWRSAKKRCCWARACRCRRARTLAARSNTCRCATPPARPAA